MFLYQDSPGSLSPFSSKGWHSRGGGGGAQRADEKKIREKDFRPLLRCMRLKKGGCRAGEVLTDPDWGEGNGGLTLKLSRGKKKKKPFCIEKVTRPCRGK